MNLLIATTEAVPFVKTGGLGDVCGSLPVELARLGNQPTVIMPAFRQVYQAGVPIEPTGVDFSVPVGSKQVSGSYLRSHLPGSQIPVIFVRQDDYYDREELYRAGGEDYRDNCERFVFFSRAVLEAVRLLDLRTDLIHANDWPTGLIPAYLEVEYREEPLYESIASLLTIHNLGYQGNFWHWDMLLTGLDWKYFNWRQMEFYGDLSLLKTGIAFADAINTVSPRYAEEIQSAPLGCGMEGILQHRCDEVTGIINGIDQREWNPATDQHLTRQYDVETVHAGKAACKQALQEELGLPVDPNTPLIAMIGRLADQKGFDLVAPVLQQSIDEASTQWVVLGTGDRQYHELFTQLATRFPRHLAARLEFSNPWAHRIEAGADMLLMPSQYEPCGLNQLYSLKYGTVPVVRATGGLADTICDATPEGVAAGTATGFCFVEYSQRALLETLRRAVSVYREDRPVWRQLIDTGMRQDWTWARSARQYDRLYQQTVSKHKQAVPAG
ncbi:MAG: glycogen synthase GlgA [Pirellulales bacterium]